MVGRIRQLLLFRTERKDRTGAGRSVEELVTTSVTNLNSDTPKMAPLVNPNEFSEVFLLFCFLFLQIFLCVFYTLEWSPCLRSIICAHICACLLVVVCLSKSFGSRGCKLRCEICCILFTALLCFDWLSPLWMNMSKYIVICALFDVILQPSS